MGVALPNTAYPGCLTKKFVVEEVEGCSSTWQQLEHHGCGAPLVECSLVMKGASIRPGGGVWYGASSLAIGHCCI